MNRAVQAPRGVVGGDARQKAGGNAVLLDLMKELTNARVGEDCVGAAFAD